MDLFYSFFSIRRPIGEVCDYRIMTAAPVKVERPGIPPSVFGMVEWASIDAKVAGLPDKLDPDTFKAVKDHMSSMRKLLPCEDCRDHYSEYYDKNAANVTADKKSVSTYWKTLRRDIAVRLGKPVPTESDLQRIIDMKHQRLMLIIISISMAICILASLGIVIHRHMKNKEIQEKQTVYAQLVHDKPIVPNVPKQPKIRPN